MSATLRDWLPFLLSAAITAGIAPLLFIQVVYQTQFYSANILLAWRWMIVVPVLIAAFYLLYLPKSEFFRHWPYLVRSLVTWGTAGCFVFVGFCWTANSILLIHEADWPEIYVSGRLPLAPLVVLSRMLIWIGASFASLSVIVGWQLFWQQSRLTTLESRTVAGTLSVLSLGGLTILAIAGLVQMGVLGQPARQALSGTGTLIYLVLSVIGIFLQAVAWIIQRRAGRLIGSWLSVVTTGAMLTLLGISFVREATRAGSIDMTRLYPRHAAAAQVDGFLVFVVFTVLVFMAMCWCVSIVRRGWQTQV